MTERRQTDETLSEQPISSQSHSTERWEDRGTRDAYGDDSGNAPPPDHAVPGERDLDEARTGSRIEEEGSRDASAPKQAARIAGIATGMFFTVVILIIVAAALILWFLLA